MGTNVSDIRIMILDDERSVGMFIEKACKSWGYQCLQHTNSRDALEYLKNEIVNIVVLDVNINESKTGVELIPDLKAVNPNILIIMLTGQNDLKTGITAMANGAFDYILKPCDFSHLEQRLKHAVEKLMHDKLNRMYVSAMVHDLRNSLNIIKVSSQLIHDTAKNQGYQRIHEISKLAVRGCFQVEKMTTNIMGLEKMTAGKYQLKKEQFTVAEVINDYLDYMNSLCEKPQLKVTYDIEADFTMNTDRELYLHVLYNLVSNAQRYSKEEIHIRVGRDQNYLITSVSNSNSYIPPEKIRWIFEPYVQGDDQKYSGLQNFGFGLAFCKVAVTCLSGTITVESKEGEKMTTFTYTVKI